MKIVKRGRKNDLQWFAECSHCGSVIQANTGEIKDKIVPGSYKSDNEEFAWCDCPVCGKQICFHDENSVMTKNILKNNSIPDMIH